MKTAKSDYLIEVWEYKKRQVNRNLETIKRLESGSYCVSTVELLLKQNNLLQESVVAIEDELNNRFGLNYCVNCSEWIDKDKFSSLSEDNICDYCIKDK